MRLSSPRLSERLGTPCDKCSEVPSFVLTLLARKEPGEAAFGHKLKTLPGRCFWAATAKSQGTCQALVVEALADKLQFLNLADRDVRQASGLLMASGTHCSP